MKEVEFEYKNLKNQNVPIRSTKSFIYYILKTIQIIWQNWL